jgi:hypothetical protein
MLPQTRLLTSSLDRARSESAAPSLLPGDYVLGKGARPGFDQFLALVDRLPVLGGHRTERLGDEAGDQARSETAATRRTRCHIVDSVPEYRRDVVGVVECVAPDDSRNQPLELVVVGLGSTKRRSEWTKGRRRDKLAVLFGGQARTHQQVGKAVALGFGGDRLKLGGQPVDATVEFVLSLDRPSGRQVSAAVLEDAVQHGPGGDVVRLGRRVAVVGLVEGDVRDVGLAAAGHGYVEVLPRRRRGHDDVRRVDGDALGAMRGHGIPEV